MIVQSTFASKAVDEPPPNGLIVDVDDQPRKVARRRPASAPPTETFFNQTKSACAAQSHAVPIRSNAEQDHATGRNRVNDHEFVPIDTCSEVVAPPTFLTLLDDIAVCPCGRAECHVERRSKGIRKPTDIVPLTLAVLDLLQSDNSAAYLLALLAYVARGVQPPSQFWREETLFCERFPPLLENAVNRLKDACDYLAVREAECAMRRFPYGCRFVGQGKRSSEALKIMHVRTNYRLAYDLLDAIGKAEFNDLDRKNAKSNARRIVLFSFEHTSNSIVYRNSVFAWWSVLRDKAPAVYAASIVSTIASLPRKKAEQVAELIFSQLCDPIRTSFPTNELVKRIRSVYPGVSQSELSARVSSCAARDGPFGEAGVPHDPHLARLHDIHEHDGHVPAGITAYLIVQKTLWRGLAKHSWTEGEGPLVMRDADGYPKRFLAPGCDPGWHDADAVGNDCPHSEAIVVRVYTEKRHTTCSSDLQASARRMIIGSKNPSTALEEVAKPACRTWLGVNSTCTSKKQRPAQWGRRMAKLAALLVTEQEIDEVLTERPSWMFRPGIVVKYREERHFARWSLAFRDAHVAFGRPTRAVNFDLASPVPVHPLNSSWPTNSYQDSCYFGAALGSLVRIRPLLLGEPYMLKRTQRNGREHGPSDYKKLGVHLSQLNVLRRAISEPRLDGPVKARGLGMNTGLTDIPDWYAEIVTESAVDSFLRLTVLFDNIVSVLKKRPVVHASAAAVLKVDSLTYSNFSEVCELVYDLHEEASETYDEVLLSTTSRFVKAPKTIVINPVQLRVASLRTTPVVDTDSLSDAFQAHAAGINSLGRASQPASLKPSRQQNLQASSDEDDESEDEVCAFPSVATESVSFEGLVWDAIMDQLGPEIPSFAPASNCGGRKTSHGILAQLEAELLDPNSAEFASRWTEIYKKELAALKLVHVSTPPRETPLHKTSRGVLVEVCTLAKAIWTKRFSARQLLAPSELGTVARKWRSTRWISRMQNRFNKGLLALSVHS